MRLKTFTAKTMQEAMADVRAALGADAIIVSSRSERKGGLVRVVAAIDREPAAERQTAEAMAPSPSGAREIGHYSVEEALLRHRAPDQLRAALLRLAGNVEAESPALELAAAFDVRLTFFPLGETDIRPLFFVGLPGAGKTVTVARLAAEAALGNEKVAIITTDVVRAGGVDQLRHYGMLAGIDVAVADTPAALSHHISTAQAEGCDRILVDTAGVNAYDSEDMENLNALVTVADGEPVFIMPAGTDPDEAHDLSVLFSDLGCRRLIVTRLDTSRRFGGILSAAVGGPLAIAGVTASPYLGDKVEIVNPVSLARLFTVRTDHATTTSSDKKQVTS